jgi:CheY-like chemotaxis protein
MAGESILVVDSSVAVQELCRNVLENHGYRVSTASNGVAALAYPQLADVNLLIIDTSLKDMSGFETTKAMKTDPELHRKPVLLLIPEENASDRENQNLYGAEAFLVKPFEPNALVNKVQVIFEELEIREQGREYLRQAADALMKKLAESHIQKSVEERTQIIIERAIQHVVTQVDQKARREVDARVTQLTTEKEQALVKTTVHEVARSMVEKLAERKVNEAMESILREETEKQVRRAADSMLPGLVRERIRENIEQLLPREVQRMVQREAETLVPDASQKVVSVIETAAGKLIPKMARERIGEQLERQLGVAIEQQLPRHVQQMVAQELEAQVRLRISPLVKEASDKINRRTMWLTAIMLILFGVGVLFMVVERIAGGYPGPRKASTSEVEDSKSKSALDALRNIKLTKPAGK